MMKTPLPLEYKIEKTLKPTSPFHFDATFYKPGHFPFGDTDWTPGIRWQTMLWKGAPLGLVFENRGSTQSPLIKVSIFADRELDDHFVEGVLEE
jgi:hypothetical protein